jgi:hypothetical protein
MRQRNTGENRARQIRLFPPFNQPHICVIFPGPHLVGRSITRAIVNKNDFKTVGRQIQRK